MWIEPQYAFDPLVFTVNRLYALHTPELVHRDLGAPVFAMLVVVITDAGTNVVNGMR